MAIWAQLTDFQVSAVGILINKTQGNFKVFTNSFNIFVFAKSTHTRQIAAILQFNNVFYIRKGSSYSKKNGNFKVHHEIVAIKTVWY